MLSRICQKRNGFGDQDWLSTVDRPRATCSIERTRGIKPLHGEVTRRARSNQTSSEEKDDILALYFGPSFVNTVDACEESYVQCKA